MRHLNFLLKLIDNGDSFVSIQFNRGTEEIYKELKKNVEIFRNKIGYNLEFDDESFTIRTDIKDKEFIYKTIDDLAQVFEQYVFYLSSYTFYYKTNVEDSMWNQHKEGTL